MTKKASKSYSYFLRISVLCLLFASCANEAKQSLVMQTENTFALDADDTQDSIKLKASHVVPTINQYDALKDEFIAFVHFGPNTFSRMEWGSGMEDPAIFNLQNLDTDQ